MDNFYEQLVTTYKTVYYKAMTFLMYITAILAVFNLLTFSFVPGLILLIGSAALYFYRRNLYIEYEYDFTNGEIDIDKIIQMKKRTRVLTFNIKNAELLAPENSDEVKSFQGKPSKVISCYPSTSKETVYIAMLTGGTERLQLRFVPDKELLNHCFKYNPRAVKRVR
jgi:hypothetical protein